MMNIGHRPPAKIARPGDLSRRRRPCDYASTDNTAAAGAGAFAFKLRHGLAAIRRFEHADKGDAYAPEIRPIPQLRPGRVPDLASDADKEISSGRCISEIYAHHSPRAWKRQQCIAS
jgi:hypothetical protein